jgi:hypothetical protein
MFCLWKLWFGAATYSCVDWIFRFPSPESPTWRHVVETPHAPLLPGALSCPSIYQPVGKWEGREEPRLFCGPPSCYLSIQRCVSGKYILFMSIFIYVFMDIFKKVSAVNPYTGLADSTSCMPARGMICEGPGHGMLHLQRQQPSPTSAAAAEFPEINPKPAARHWFRSSE